MTRLDENRNRIMHITLIMEMCMLGVGVGAVIAGIFGKYQKLFLEQTVLQSVSRI